MAGLVASLPRIVAKEFRGPLSDTTRVGSILQMPPKHACDFVLQPRSRGE